MAPLTAAENEPAGVVKEAQRHTSSTGAVRSTEALLIIEGEERHLTAWDFVHCPPKVSHVIVGVGERRSVVLALGGRDRMTGEESLGYPVDPVAVRHHAGVEHETTDPSAAYAGLPRRQPTAFDPAWLPE